MFGLCCTLWCFIWPCVEPCWLRFHRSIRGLLCFGLGVSLFPNMLSNLVFLFVFSGVFDIICVFWGSLFHQCHITLRNDELLFDVVAEWIPFFITPLRKKNKQKKRLYMWTSLLKQT